MKKLGLIGGTGPESTIEYYKGKRNSTPVELLRQAYCFLLFLYHSEVLQRFLDLCIGRLTALLLKHFLNIYVDVDIYTFSPH